MMKSGIALALVAAVLCCAWVREASADTSVALVQLCRDYLALEKPADGVIDPKFVQLKSSCAGFINSHVKMSKPEDGFCVPKGYHMDDVAKVYMAWIDKNPGRVGDPTGKTMTEALIERYPCAK